MKAWKRQGRGDRVRYVAVLERPEASVLRGLMGQVEQMLTGRNEAAPEDELAAITGIRTGPSTPPDDPVLARLLPDFASSGEEDAGELSAALRSVNEPELIEAKLDAIATVLATCPAGGGRVELAPSQAEEWLAAVNDVRLALGVALEVTEDMPEQLPADDPRADHLPVYHWLTWLQDSLVSTLMA
ncbi:uncharacterized protein DUF2017 [Actinomycetospora succinea]|uniref:Uncharacterized protein DUF2017 n=1 Tax=Actinomycetospora succinea TaxID=663603 RepID=A0A4R6V9M5_9PSEU|nr:DUF2017 domain-containing protein [Actinomycetospora succinea]TDQ58587.1 uncharacterized protein DUF2017 [Actinomycetospora succinea]